MREDIASLNELTRKIAAALGSPWRYVEQNDEPYPTDHVDDGNGARLYFRWADYNKRTRIAVSGSLHIGKNGSYEEVRENGHRVPVPDITVAVERGVEKIVAEIRRRLLPEYMRLLGIARAQVASHNDYEGTRRANLTALAAIVCTSEPKNDEQASVTYYHNDGRGYGDIWCSADSCNLKLSSLSIATAREVLELLAGKAAL